MHNVAILSDEIHMDVRRPGEKHRPILEFIDSIEVPAVLLSSASKTFNTPGLGGSYAIFWMKITRKIFDDIESKRWSIVDSISCTTSDNGLLSESKEWAVELNQTIDENFFEAKKILSADPRIHFTIPEATYLGWINIKDLPYSMDELQSVLVKQERIAIMNGKVYGPEGKTYLRFNLGAPKEKIIAGLEGLMHAIDSLDQKHLN